MNKKSLLRCLFLCCASLLLAVLLGTLSLTAVYALPTEPMKMNLKENRALIQQEGHQFFWAPPYVGTRLDGFTDYIMLQTAIYRGTGNHLCDALMNERMCYYDNQSPGEGLSRYLAGDESGIPVAYARYWHGYLLLLKPLLLFSSLSDIRMMNMILQWSLAMVLLLLCFRKGGYRLAIPMGLSILFLNPVTTALSMQYSSVYLLTLIFSILQLRFSLYEKKDGWLLYLWLGILTAFFDFLTYPPAALGICLTLGVVLMEGTARKRLYHTFTGGICWGIGYAGMWSSKWLVSTKLTGINVLASAAESAIYRTGGEILESETGKALTFGQILAQNLAVNANKAYLLFLIALVLLTGYLLLFKGFRPTLPRDAAPALVLIAAIPFVWYFILQNHSGIHYWMTHRDLAPAVMAIACILSFSLRKEHRCP